MTGLRWRSVRVRMVVGAVVVLGVLLAVAALGYDRLLHDRLLGNLDTSLETQTADRAGLLSAGAAPDAVATAVGEEAFALVLGRSGEVLASSGLADPSGLTDLPPGTVVGRDVALSEGEPGESEVHALRVATAVTSHGRRVVVGRATESIAADRRDARTLLLGGLPVVLAGAAVLVWVVVGRALRPVDRLRSDVEAIVATGAGQRVGPPGTADEIDRLASTMNDMLGRLDDQAEARRRFVSDASHELKSPVANVRALVESAPGELAPEDWSELRAALVGEANRLQLLVDDLLFLARGDEAGLEPVRSVVHLDDVVFDEAERLDPLTPAALDASGVTPVDVVGDAAQLARLVRNLVENAARHAAGRVVIELREDDGRARLVVADDGPGIPEAERARVFERFVRVGTGRDRAAGGTGLGLAIVAQIAAAHGGTVQADSAELGGAALVVDLPVAG